MNNHIIKNDFSGKRTLFYNREKSSFSFDDFLEEGNLINRESVIDFLLFGTILPPNSPITDVKLAFPGESVDLKDGRNSTCEYKDLSIETKRQSTEEIVDELDKMFENYYSQYRGKKNTLLLSGGVDSAIILSYLGSDTNCITWGGHGENTTDVVYSKETAKAFGVKNHNLVFINPEKDLELYKRDLARLKLPMYYMGSIPYIRMSRIANKIGSESFFMGQNADTLFMSYACPINIKKILFLKNFLPFNPLHFSKSRKKYLLSTKSIVKLFAYYKSNGIFPGDWIKIPDNYFESKEFFLKKYLKSNDSSQNIILTEELLTESRRNQFYQNEIPNLYNIKTICPYYEKWFVEYMLRVPSSLRKKNKYSKVIFKMLAKKRGIPDSVIYHPKKGLSCGYGETLKKKTHVKIWDKMESDDFMNSFVDIKRIRNGREDDFLVFDVLKSLYYWRDVIVRSNRLKY